MRLLHIIKILLDLGSFCQKLQEICPIFNLTYFLWGKKIKIIWLLILSYFY